MSSTIQLALIQAPLVWENPEANRNYFTRKIHDLSEDIDLVVLPEMYTTGFTMTPGNVDVGEGRNTVEWMRQLCRDKALAMIGSIVFEEEGNHYNRLFFVLPNGECFQYDKKHTFTLAGEDKVYQSGSDRVVLEYRGFRFCPMICYDLRFPVWSRNTDNYDVLLYVANWPKPRVDAWDTLLKARAIENMVYCVGVNRVGSDGLGQEYVGHSAVYGPLGKQLVFSEEETVLTTTLDKGFLAACRDKFRFLEDRDVFTLLP